MPKTSDLDSAPERKAPKKPEYLSPAGLAGLVGPLKGRAGRERQNCSERTVREWCERGLIPEAYQTRGGHWRIRMPLSLKTRYELDKRSADWPFDKNAGDFQGDWNPEEAEWLMLAQLYQQRLDEDFPVPTIAELADTLDADRIDASDPRASAARQIQDEIMQRAHKGKSFRDLLLLGWVYQFWRRYKRRPTVAEIAELMGLSVGAFYRRYTRAEMYKAFRTASGRVAPYQTQGRRTRKRGFEALKRQLEM